MKAITLDQSSRLLAGDGEAGSDRGRRAHRANDVAVEWADPVAVMKPDDDRPSTFQPSSLTAFVGRRAELTAVDDLLASSRLVTLTGVGGIGKTRLACEMTQRVARAFDDGCHFVDLTPLREGSAVAEAVVSGLGLTAATSGGPELQLRRYLVDRRVLIVLDNCEHVLDDARRLVSSLLVAAPGLQILATAREPFGLAGERTVVVRPLDFPRSDEVPPLAEARGCDAVALLERRAAMVNDRFEITEANIDAAVRLCERLDGLPLAIELAAARLRTFTLEQVLARLDDRFSILGKGDPTAAPHHRTLRGLVEWSYDLCTVDEQLLWRRMAPFAGGADLEAVEKVCGSVPLDSGRAVDALDGLVTKSILLVEAGPSPSGSRYRLLETLRDFAREKAAQHPEESDTRPDHAAHFLDVAVKAGHGLFDQVQEDWMARIAADRANLAEAYLFLRDEAADPDGALRMASALRFYWTTRQLREGRRWLEEALSAGRASPEVRGEALWSVAWVAALQGEPHAASAYLREASAIAERIDDRRMAAHVDTWQATVALFSGDLESADVLFERALEAHREHADREGLLMTLFQLAITSVLRSDHTKAGESCAEALAESRSHGEKWARSYALWAMAYDAWVRQDLQVARACADDSLRLKDQLSDGIGSALVVSLLAAVMVDLGDIAGAAGMLGVGTRLWSGLGTSIDAFGPQLASTESYATERVLSSLGPDRLDELRVAGSRMADDEWADRLLRRQETPSPQAGIETLTSRESEVALLLGQGKSNREIANELVLSHRTVEGHVQHILAKLGAKSRTEAAVLLASASAEV